jgi:hypothetical protein
MVKDLGTMEYGLVALAGGGVAYAVDRNSVAKSSMLTFAALLMLFFFRKLKNFRTCGRSY